PHPLCPGVTATTAVYPLSLHDALPIWGVPGHGRRARGLVRGEEPEGGGAQEPVVNGGGRRAAWPWRRPCGAGRGRRRSPRGGRRDRKSTRLNSSHVKISYAVFCLKKKK